MVWKQVSDSRWERPVDGLEGYFAAIGEFSARVCDGREHYTLFSNIKLEVDLPDIEAALKHAWKQIRYEQPQIATTTEGMKKVYEIPDEIALEEWLKSTFIVSSASSSDELYESVTPIKQATLYYVPKSSELIFRGHHHTIDGVGMLLFWDSYLNALASPMENIKFGDEACRLAPIMEEVLGFPEQLTPEKTQKATELFMDYAVNNPGIGPVSQLGAAPSGKCKHTELVFPTKTTEALVKACENRGISVTAAIHAAYIQAITKHADPNSNLSKYNTATSINLRSYLPKPYNSAKYGVSVFYTPLPYKINLPVSFEDAVLSLNEFYRNSFKSNPELLELKGTFMRVLCGAAQSPEFLAAPPSKDALVSSLGVIERYMQREYCTGIKVEEFKMGADIVMGMSMFFFYTFHDSLRLVYSFNDGFEDPQKIQMYLEEVQSVLVQKLLI